MLADGGGENYNSAVDKLVYWGILKRILAQTEIRHSNSLIESRWRVIKRQSLFLNTLETVTSVMKLVEFYVEKHNSYLVHSAFKDQTPGEMYFTPDDMYFAMGAGIPKKLKEEKLRARELRLKKIVNGTAMCVLCRRLQAAQQTTKRNRQKVFCYAAQSIDQVRLEAN